MGSVKVYGPPASTAVARVLACLLEKEVEFQLIPVNMAKGSTKPPNTSRSRKPPFVDGNLGSVGRSESIPWVLLLLQQPFGQVPAFQDESITLFGNKGLFGNGLLERASIEQWLEAEAQSFNPPSSVLVFQLAFAPRMRLKQDPAVIEQNEGKLAKVLDVYENRLEESRFLAGDDFTLADLSHLPNAQYITGTDRGHLLTSRKNVNRWWEEISSRPSWKKVVEMQKAPPS
ncbi:unnamed protein product [Spirodela intermedia]|uniref:glutathione transferase n=1 Tax=Spirodela intermedia TaxID=51605 RepID=A0A7I8IEE0_SPIIN|nr:unnamed protein product [Spirodela intermedia]CAA6656039.1 unnamed protein product [Spirodela intermedia]